MDTTQQHYRLGRFTFDSGRGTLTGPDGATRLRPKTCEVLLCLVRHPGRLVSRNELMEAVWGKALITDDSLTQCLVEIRRALGDDARQMVRTVPRRGYVLDAVPAPLEPAPDPPGPEPGPAPSARGRRSPGRLPLLLASAVLAALLAWWALGGLDAPPPAVSADATVPNSIAVLPFVDLSAGRDQAHLGEGIAEEILNALAQYRDLKVIARTSSFSFRDRPLDARTIAEQLGVTHLLEGSVRKSGDRVRVIAQLIDARDGSHLWSKDFDRELGDIFEVQHEIAGSITGLLEVATSGEPANAGRHSVAAYERLLQGRYLHQRRGPGDLERAIGHFEAAIDIDPGYAAAWAALAGALIAQLDVDHPAEQPGFARARAAVARALELDPRSVEGHLRAAVIEHIRDDVASAWRHIGIAGKLEPDNVLLLGLLAGRASSAGELDAAIELQQRALVRDPLSAVNRLNLANYLIAAGRLEDARRNALAALELSPESRSFVNDSLAAILIVERRYEDAAQLLDELPDDERADVMRAIVSEALGRATGSGPAIERLRARDSWSADLGLAEIHAHFGRAEEAWHWLERSRQRVPSDAFHVGQWTRLAWLSCFLRPLQDDPRWTALLEGQAPSPGG